MQRLTEKQSSGYDLIEMNGRFCDEYCHTQSVETCIDCVIDKAIQKLAEYEDLEEQGLMIKLPCKIGDTIYKVSKIGKGHWEEDKYIIDDEGEWAIYKAKFNLILLKYIGENVFLTKEEAEAKLREMEVGE